MIETTPRRGQRRGVLWAIAAAALLAGCAQLPDPRAARDAQALVFPPPPEPPRFFYERTIYSSADIAADSTESALRRALTGEGRSGTPLAKPYAVAVHRGRVCLSDSVERFVKGFAIPSERYFRCVETAPFTGCPWSRGSRRPAAGRSRAPCAARARRP